MHAHVHGWRGCHGSPVFPRLVLSLHAPRAKQSAGGGGGHCAVCERRRRCERPPGGTRAVCANFRSSLRTAAAGGSPGRARGTPASAQLAVHCRRPARLRPTTPRLCGSCAAALVARRRSYARGHNLFRGPRARGVVSTTERHSERAMPMGTAFTSGHPASPLDPHALVRTAFDHSEADRRGLCDLGDETRAVRWFYVKR